MNQTAAVLMSFAAVAVASCGGLANHADGGGGAAGASGSGGASGVGGSSGSGGTSGSGGSGGVAGQPDSGGADAASCPSNAGLVTLASGQEALSAIAVSATHVYWIAQGTSVTPAAVRMVPIDGGTPVALVTAHAGLSFGLALNSTHVFWNDSTGVWTAPLDGGTPTLVVATGDPSYHLSIDSKSAYWTDNAMGTVVKAPLAGGVATTLASEPYPTDLAVDSENVYFTAQAGVFKTPIAGGSTKLLAPGSPNLIAVDDANVYWTAGSVMQAPKTGGKAITLAASSGAQGIAVDGSSVYWAEWGPCAPTCKTPVGSIVKVPIGGGKPVTLACSQSLPTALAVDAANVYWVNNGNGTVKQLTHK